MAVCRGAAGPPADTRPQVRIGTVAWLARVAIVLLLVLLVLRKGSTPASASAAAAARHTLLLDVLLLR